MATEYKPNYANHPGLFLNEDLKALKISQKKFAEMTGISKTIINEIIKGKRDVNARIAVLFEQYLGEPAEFWMKIQAAYDLFIERQKFSVVGISQSCSFDGDIKILTPIAA